MVSYFRIDMTKILILRQEIYLSPWRQSLKSMIFGSIYLGPCGEEKQRNGRSMWSVCSSRGRQEAHRGNTKRCQADAVLKDTPSHLRPSSQSFYHLTKIVSPSMSGQTFSQACGRTLHISTIPVHSSNGSPGQT